MKKFAIFVFSLFSFGAIQAQTVLLEKNPEAPDSLSIENGPNTKHFVHTFFGLGFAIPENGDYQQIKFFNSGEFYFGFRYKRKLSTTFSTGLDLTIKYNYYRLKDPHDIFLVTPFLPIEKQKFKSDILELGYFFRVNFNPNRGNVMGTYLDLGASGAWMISHRHQFEYEVNDEVTREVTTKGLNTVEPFTAFARARFGFIRYILYADYRLTDIFNEKIKELPPIMIGLQIGLHQ